MFSQIPFCCWVNKKYAVIFIKGKKMNLNMFELFIIIVVASIVTLAVEHGVTGQPETRVFCGQILLGLLFIASVISILSRMSA